MSDDSDFLGLDADTKSKAALREQGLRIAKLYTVFQSNEQCRELLALWESTLANKRTPVNATINEYAANEALRAFVQGIHEQIRLAKTLDR